MAIGVCNLQVIVAHRNAYLSCLGVSSSQLCDFNRRARFHSLDLYLKFRQRALKAMNDLKISSFWGFTSCVLVDRYQRLGGTCSMFRSKQLILF
jgi:hypothetical protein